MKTIKLIPVLILATASLSLSPTVMADVIENTWHAAGKVTHGAVGVVEKSGKVVYNGGKTVVKGTVHAVGSLFR